MKRILPFAFALLFLTGCWDQQVIEKTGFILLQGVEYGNQNQLLFTNVIPVIGIEQKNKIQVVSISAVNPRDSREIGRRMSSLGLTGGKMQELLFSDAVARKGIHDFLEVYERDPSNPILAYVVVVDGSPKQIIDKTESLENRQPLPNYLYGLLEQNVQKDQIPETRVYQYDVDYFADGIDPVTPLIALNGQDIVAEGSALFKNDRMVGKLDARHTVLLQILRGDFKPTEYTFLDPGFSGGNTTGNTRSGLNFYIRKAKSRISVRIENNVPVIRVAIQMEGAVSEYRWNQLDEDTEQKKLDKLMSAEIRREGTELLKYCRSVGSDPVGFGNMVRENHYSYWKKTKWPEDYQKAVFEVSADVTYDQNGAVK